MNLARIILVEGTHPESKNSNLVYKETPFGTKLQKFAVNGFGFVLLKKPSVGKGFSFVLRGHLTLPAIYP